MDPDKMINPLDDKKEKSLWTDKNFYIINLLSIVGMMSNMLTTAQPLLSETFGVSAAQIGLLNTAYSAPVLFISPIVGILIDRFGRKKVLIASIAAFGIGGMMTVWAANYQMLLLFSFLRGLGSPGISIIGNALVGDFYKSVKQRATVMGMKNSWTNVGNAIYPLIGGFLIGYSWKAPYLAFVVALLMIIPVMMMDEPEGTGKKSGTVKEYLRDIGDGIKNAQFLSLSVISFIVYMLLAGFFNSYVPFLVREMIGPTQIGLVMSIMAVAGGIFSMLYGPLVKAFSEELLCKAALAAFLLAFITGLNAQSTVTVYLFSAFFGTGIGLVMPAYMSIFMTITTNENRGALIAANNMIKRFGQLLGPVLAGIAYVKGGLSEVFLWGAVISGVILIYSLFALRKKEK